MGNAAVVKELLEASADVDTAREVGCTYNWNTVTMVPCLSFELLSSISHYLATYGTAYL